MNDIHLIKKQNVHGMNAIVESFYVSFNKLGAYINYRDALDINLCDGTCTFLKRSKNGESYYISNYKNNWFVNNFPEFFYGDLVKFVKFEELIQFFTEALS